MALQLLLQQHLLLLSSMADLVQVLALSLMVASTAEQLSMVDSVAVLSMVAWV